MMTTSDGQQCCAAVSPKGFFCTKAKGHKDDHVATGGVDDKRNLLDQWTNRHPMIGHKIKLRNTKYVNKAYEDQYGVEHEGDVILDEVEIEVTAWSEDEHQQQGAAKDEQGHTYTFYRSYWGEGMGSRTPWRGQDREWYREGSSALHPEVPMADHRKYLQDKALREQQDKGAH